jgi:hypothetical protein
MLSHADNRGFGATWQNPSGVAYVRIVRSGSCCDRVIGWMDVRMDESDEGRWSVSFCPSPAFEYERIREAKRGGEGEKEGRKEGRVKDCLNKDHQQNQDVS